MSFFLLDRSFFGNTFTASANAATGTAFTIKYVLSGGCVIGNINKTLHTPIQRIPMNANRPAGAYFTRFSRIILRQNTSSTFVANPSPTTRYFPVVSSYNTHSQHRHTESGLPKQSSKKSSESRQRTYNIIFYHSFYTSFFHAVHFLYFQYTSFQEICQC